MLVGTIEKRGQWWIAVCELIGAFTQARTRKEAMENLGDVVELRVERKGFEATVTEIARQGTRAFTVLVDPSDPAQLAAAVLKYQRARHGLSLADVAKKLGVSSRNAYARYEHGTSEPSLGKLRELLGGVAPEITMLLDVTRSSPPASGRGHQKRARPSRACA